MFLAENGIEFVQTGHFLKIITIATSKKSNEIWANSSHFRLKTKSQDEFIMKKTPQLKIGAFFCI
ncbi:MAG: hypothetical protein CR994_02905 [Maribacter sp.]|nr:MAG: hypothetical protein CR994_02905 [Maribacter sp.]